MAGGVVSVLTMVVQSDSQLDSDSRYVKDSSCRLKWNNTPPCLAVIAEPSVSTVWLQSLLGKCPSKYHYGWSDEVCVWRGGGCKGIQFLSCTSIHGELPICLLPWFDLRVLTNLNPCFCMLDWNLVLRASSSQKDHCTDPSALCPSSGPAPTLRSAQGHRLPLGWVSADEARFLRQKAPVLLLQKWLYILLRDICRWQQ